MKGLDVNAKKQYETPTMELLVITGREMMGSEHDNGYVDIGGIIFPKLGGFHLPGYYDE